MKVSVIIPTYNRKALLMKCIKCLGQQNFSKTDYEVIIVTDGPDINTKTEVAFFNQHSFFNLYCYSLDAKKGPAAARNKGASLAKGELLVFTDDDCRPQQDWLQTYWNFYQSTQKKEVAFSGRTIVPHSTEPTDYEKNIANLERSEFITANCACTKTAFEKVNGFDEEFSIAWREDSDLHFKFISENIPIIKVQNAIVVHPVRNAKWGISLREQKKSMFNALLHKKYPSLYREKISSHPLWNYYAMVVLLPFAIINIINGSTVTGITCLFVWLILLVQFTIKRLSGTKKNFGHIIEMIITSALIPFLSVYWTLYGSFKYKTLLL